MCDSSEEILRLEHVWRRYRKSSRPPGGLKDAFVRFLRGERTQYEDFWAARDVSFSVRRGEVVGLCGANGTGKSSLLRMIGRIDPPTHGKITVSGKVVSLLDLTTGFHHNLTGRENILLNWILLGMDEEDLAGQQDSIIDFADIGDFIDSPVSSYSAGMYLRLGFSIATHVNAEILLIDEILSVGDEQFQEKCRAWARGLRHDQVTVIIVSHDLKSLAAICDRMIWFDGGQVREDGKPREVLLKYCPGLDLPGEQDFGEGGV